MTYSYPVEYVAGGSAQNTVRILCKLIKNQWPSYVIGKIAHDPVGVILQKLLAQDGVGTRSVLFYFIFFFLNYQAKQFDIINYIKRSCLNPILTIQIRL